MSRLQSAFLLHFTPRSTVDRNSKELKKFVRKVVGFKATTWGCYSSFAMQSSTNQLRAHAARFKYLRGTLWTFQLLQSNRVKGWSVRTLQICSIYLQRLRHSYALEIKLVFLLLNLNRQSSKMWIIKYFCVFIGLLKQVPARYCKLIILNFAWFTKSHFSTPVLLAKWGTGCVLYSWLFAVALDIIFNYM